MEIYESEWIQPVNQPFIHIKHLWATKGGKTFCVPAHKGTSFMLMSVTKNGEGYEFEQQEPFDTIDEAKRKIEKWYAQM